MSTNPPPGKSKASKNKLVIFAPYPPAKSGIADYAAELMPWLCAEFDVSLVIADDAPVPKYPELRVLLASEFWKFRKHFVSVPKLYHVGNNSQHSYMLDFLANDPGVVVMHDFNLVYLHEMATLRWSDREGQRRAMESEYGGLGRDLFEWEVRTGYRELFAASELPLNGDVLERATAIIAHSRQVQYRASARAPTKPVWYVPHHLSPQTEKYRSLSKQAARAQVALPQNEIIVTALGFVTRAKQIRLILECLAALEGEVPEFRFVLAGERRPSEYDVDADIASAGLQGRVTCTDYLDEDLFFKHVVAADIVVNLRYPGGGETSGSLVRALGLGAPTVVVDFGPMGELPDAVVRKVPWTDERRGTLTGILRELMLQPAARYELGRRAAQYTTREHNIAKSAGLYVRAIREASGPAGLAVEPIKTYFQGPRILAQNLRELGPAGKDLIERCDARICWTVPAFPSGGENDAAALVVSTDPSVAASLLCQVFKWRPENVVAISVADFLGSAPKDAAGIPIRVNAFTAALAIVPSDLDEPSAALLMRRLNSTMRRGAGICVELYADIDRELDCLPPLARENLAQRLRDSGFSSLRDWQSQDGFILDLVAPAERPANRTSCCMSALKVSDYAVWRYVEHREGAPMRWGGRIEA